MRRQTSGDDLNGQTDCPPGRQPPGGAAGTGGDGDGRTPGRRPVDVQRAESDPHAPSGRGNGQQHARLRRGRSDSPKNHELDCPVANVPAGRRIGRVAAVGDIGLDAQRENGVRPARLGHLRDTAQRGRLTTQGHQESTPAPSRFPADRDRPDRLSQRARFSCPGSWVNVRAL